MLMSSNIAFGGQILGFFYSTEVKEVKERRQYEVNQIIPGT